MECSKKIASPPSDCVAVCKYEIGRMSQKYIASLHVSSCALGMPFGALGKSP